MNKNTPQCITSKSEQETQFAAQVLAQKIIADKKNAQILCLYGDLGAGKSVFARALIRALVDDPALTVPSPTFTLVQTYDSAYGPIYHYDLYRLEDPEEIIELGWEDSLSEGLSIVEWPQRLAGMKPPGTLDISIQQADNGQDRIITITGG